MQPGSTQLFGKRVFFAPVFLFFVRTFPVFAASLCFFGHIIKQAAPIANSNSVWVLGFGRVKVTIVFSVLMRSMARTCQGSNKSASPVMFTLPRTRTLPCKHALPDTAGYPYSCASPHISALPNTFAPFDTLASSDTSALPYTYALSDTQELPDTSAFPYYGGNGCANSVTSWGLRRLWLASQHPSRAHVVSKLSLLLNSAIIK